MPPFLGPPDPPVDVDWSEQNGRKVKVSWTMGRDNRSPAFQVYIQGRTAFEVDKWTTILISNNTKTRASKYIELSPWTEYKLRVISENKVGRSVPSEETKSWIRIPPAAPEVYPTNIQGVGTAPSELLITWDVSSKFLIWLNFCLFVFSVDNVVRLI